jgi:quinol---cytochrome c reductase cytochrome c subunit, bacillus type
VSAVSARKVINRRVRYETEHAAEVHEGHPFFPYAMFHDVVVNLIVVLMIVAMAVIWHATAGPINAAHPNGQNGIFGALYEQKANPAVQATEPRPEWYFLFLFELLRIFKTPAELILATIVIPTIWMVLLIAWPFLDRGRDRRLSRRPWGVALGLSVPAVLIALTIAGSIAPGVASGSNVTAVPAINALPGAADISGAGCTTCHNFGAGGGNVGMDLSHGSAMFGTNQAEIQAWLAGGAHKKTGIMPDYTSLGKTEIADIAQVVASLKTGSVQPLQK